MSGLVLGLTTGVAVATPTQPSATSKKPAPATPRKAVTSQDKNCTLHPSLTHPVGEQQGCLAVGTKLSRIPTVGQTATLTVTVKAARAERNTQVTVDLPQTVAFADGTTTHADYSGAGPVKRTAPATMSLAAGQSRSFTRIVKATGAGFSEISASASNRLSADRTDSAKDSVFFTAATTAARSKTVDAGGVDTAGSAGRTVTTNAKIAGPERVTSKPLRTLTVTSRPSRQVSRSNAGAPGTSCVTGGFVFVDQNGVTRALHNVVVQVFNAANSALLGSQFSGGDGRYNICFSTGGAATTVSIHFVYDNNAWRVQDFSNNTYNYVVGNTVVPDGTTQDFGFKQPANNSEMRGAHAFQEADDEYQWLYQYVAQGSGCYSPFSSTCRSLTIHWAPGNTTMGTNWNPSRQVWLLDGSPDTLDEPVHEYAHNLMYDLYGQTFPDLSCGAHDLFTTAKSTTCAWTEGFADWAATSIYNNTVWTYNGGGQRDFNVTWNEGLGYATGDQVEGRIVQAMRSLSDGTKAPWDNDPGEGGGIKDNSRIFFIMRDFKPDTFADVWADRAAKGYDTSQTALSALYQGTIDYGFRNPLSDYVGKHFPKAVPDHNYSHTTTTGYWSVVALKPDAGSDVDLSLYNDFGLTSILGSSAFSNNATDFVAINSNSGHRAFQTYYPVAHQFGGTTGGYTIEDAQGTDILSSGSSTKFLSSSQPVQVWDSNQSAGVPVYYRAVPLNGQDVLLDYVSAGDSDGIVARGSALESVDPSAGNAATLQITPDTSGFSGLVLLNNSLTSGSVTVYADTSAPTGSVSINDGAASTRTDDVSLTLSASDSQTGVDAMQISTDGTFDTENVVSYSTSANTTLPAPNGTKTVYVRYRNNAGQWSDPVTDTITLNAVNVTAIVPKTGSVSGGKTVTILGEGFIGVTSVKFSTSPATSYTVVNSKKITAVTPAHAAGPAYVYVTATGVTNAAVPESRYTYVSPPTVTSVAPTVGSTAGGQLVTIRGTGFTDASAVKFGTTNGTGLTVVNSTKITVTAPAHAVGSVNVYVVTPSGTSAATTNGRYTYQAPPTVSSVSPASGTTAGGTSITITGSGFTGVTAVKFSNTAAASYTVVSSTKITAVTPGRPSGVTNVLVTTGGGTSATVIGDRYTFV